MVSKNRLNSRILVAAALAILGGGIVARADEQQKRYERPPVKYYKGPHKEYFNTCIYYLDTPPDKSVVLDPTGIWRCFNRFASPPGARGKQALKQPSPAPPKNWMGSDFDDSRWLRRRRVYDTRYIRSLKKEEPSIRFYEYDQYGYLQPSLLSLQCWRARFKVDDAKTVKSLKLAVEYRGGVAVYLNGKEIARQHLPEGELSAQTMAAAYDNESLKPPNSWGKWYGSFNEGLLLGRGKTEHYYGRIKAANARIRVLNLEIDRSAIRDGVNVLCVEIHAAPALKREGGGDWNTCGLVDIKLRADGSVTSSINRPPGVQVWAVDPHFRINQFSSHMSGRIGAGSMVILHQHPLTWADPNEPKAELDIAASRNGVFCDQLVVSSNKVIQGLKAQCSDLTGDNGKKLPVEAVDLRYMPVLESAPKSMRDLPVGKIDMLFPTAPDTVSMRERALRGKRSVDPGAVTSIWVRVRVPADAAAGTYEGTIRISTAESEPIEVPLKVRVADFLLPEPVDFQTQMSIPQSPRTLAATYGVKMWSDEHFKLIEKSFEYMKQLGAQVVFLNLVTDTAWLQAKQSIVRWVRQPNGGYTFDFKAFDRYLDVAQKYLRPDTVVLVTGLKKYAPLKVTVLDPATGATENVENPTDASAWKSLTDQVLERLKKRGLAKYAMWGVLMDGMPAASFFEWHHKLQPNLGWCQLAHYGGKLGKQEHARCDFAMSVWGRQRNEVRTLKHFRADPLIDLRPVKNRCPLRLAPESAKGGNRCEGMGPIGADFWPAKVKDKRGKISGRVMEGGGNLSMNAMSTSAMLGPGPEGPLPTARFDILREGIQAYEALHLIRTALKNESTGAALAPDLAKHCQVLMQEHNQAWKYIRAGERKAQGEGWFWYMGSGWQERTKSLFDAAGKIQIELKLTKKKLD